MFVSLSLPGPSPPQGSHSGFLCLLTQRRQVRAGTLGTQQMLIYCSSLPHSILADSAVCPEAQIPTGSPGLCFCFQAQEPWGLLCSLTLGPSDQVGLSKLPARRLGKLPGVGSAALLTLPKCEGAPPPPVLQVMVFGYPSGVTVLRRLEVTSRARLFIYRDVGLCLSYSMNAE